jgi:hypothetical protein
MFISAANTQRGEPTNLAADRGALPAGVVALLPRIAARYPLVTESAATEYEPAAVTASKSALRRRSAICNTQQRLGYRQRSNDRPGIEPDFCGPALALKVSDDVPGLIANLEAIFSACRPGADRPALIALSIKVMRGLCQGGRSVTVT